MMQPIRMYSFDMDRLQQLHIILESAEASLTFTNR